MQSSEGTVKENMGPGSSPRSWPIDLLGNELRRGQLVSFRVPEQIIIARVADVVQAGIMHGPDNRPIMLQGTIKLALDVGYKHDTPLSQILAVKEPDTRPA